MRRCLITALFVTTSLSALACSGSAVERTAKHAEAACKCTEAACFDEPIFAIKKIEFNEGDGLSAQDRAAVSAALMSAQDCLKAVTAGGGE